MSAWKSCLLGEVAELIRGITFKPNNVVPLGTVGSVACMRTKNVQRELDTSDVWAVDESFVRRSNQFLRMGDILVSSANSWNLVGKCCWVPQLQWSTSFGGFVSVLRARTEDVDSRFLFRWFSSRRVQSMVRSFGRQTTNISNLNIDRCLSLELPLPPLAEQRRIAELLDRCDALHTKRREAIFQLDELTRSTFLDMFGDRQGNPKKWAYATLGHVVELYSGGTLPPGEKYRAQADGYFLLKVSDMNLPGNEELITSCQEWSPIPGARSATCPPGSIVIPKRGGAIGTNKKRLTTRSSILDPNLMAVWPRPESLQFRYLYQWFLEFNLMSITNGSSVPQLNKRDLEPLPIALPPGPLQEKFAERTAQVTHMKTVQQVYLAELDALFASLQYRAFRGEL